MIKRVDRDNWEPISCDFRTWDNGVTCKIDERACYSCDGCHVHNVDKLLYLGRKNKCRHGFGIVLKWVGITK